MLESGLDGLDLHSSYMAIAFVRVDFLDMSKWPGTLWGFLVDHKRDFTISAHEVAVVVGTDFFGSICTVHQGRHVNRTPLRFMVPLQY